MLPWTYSILNLKSVAIAWLTRFFSSSHICRCTWHSTLCCTSSINWSVFPSSTITWAYGYNRHTKWPIPKFCSPRCPKENIMSKMNLPTSTRTSLQNTLYRTTTRSNSESTRWKRNSEEPGCSRSLSRWLKQAGSVTGIPQKGSLKHSSTTVTFSSSRIEQ